MSADWLILAALVFIGFRPWLWFRRADIVTIGLGTDSLAMRRLRRVAEFPRDRRDVDEEFYAHRCETCGRPWMWNPAIFPKHEPHRCEKCSPDEHWYTGVPSEIANKVLSEYAS